MRRYNDTWHPLDEAALRWTTSSEHVVTCNHGPQHGHWVLYVGRFLRVQLNVGGDTTLLKWVLFQNVPGSLTWLGIKDEDHGWTVVMSVLFECSQRPGPAVMYRRNDSRGAGER